MKSIHVVAAVIFSPERSDILIAKRLDHLHQGGLWEFPGGKVESNETPLDALTRELREELNIELITAKPLLTVSHHYPDKSVLLDVWQLNDFAGEARGMEGQEVRWIRRSELLRFNFPDANYPIIEKVLHTS